MSITASKYYSITDMFFKNRKEVDLRPGFSVLNAYEPPIQGIHIFNWGPESYLTVETAGNQIIKFPSTSLIEGAIYYVKINKIIEAGPNSKETQVMGISTSENV